MCHTVSVSPCHLLTHKKMCSRDDYMKTGTGQPGVAKTISEKSHEVGKGETRGKSEINWLIPTSKPYTYTRQIINLHVKNY